MNCAIMADLQRLRENVEVYQIICADCARLYNPCFSDESGLSIKDCWRKGYWKELDMLLERHCGEICKYLNKVEEGMRGDD